ncbi:hypothetical protein J6590_078691 [Homalodisca vitripennis]|nr:hypothetical protein J6590_078691 [Homalodisca vitripennis]
MSILTIITFWFLIAASQDVTSSIERVSKFVKGPASGADVRRLRCAVSHNSCSLASNEHLGLTCGIISLIQLPPYYLQRRWTKTIRVLSGASLDLVTGNHRQMSTLTLPLASIIVGRKTSRCQNCSCNTAAALQSGPL